MGKRKRRADRNKTPPSDVLPESSQMEVLSEQRSSDQVESSTVGSISSILEIVDDSLKLPQVSQLPAHHHHFSRAMLYKNPKYCSRKYYRRNLANHAAASTSRANDTHPVDESVIFKLANKYCSYDSTQHTGMPKTNHFLNLRKTKSNPQPQIDATRQPSSSIQCTSQPPPVLQPLPPPPQLQPPPVIQPSQPPLIQPSQPPVIQPQQSRSHSPTSDAQPSKKRVGRENQRYWTVDTIDSHGTIKRCKVKVKEVLNIPQSQRIIVNFNDQHQAIGEEQGLLAGFCGSLATDYALFPINFEKWPDMPESYFNNCFAKIIKPRFDFKTSDEAAKRYVSQSISKKWAQSRLSLWNEFYDPTASRDDIIENVPVGIQRDQWATYVDYRLNPKTMEKCRKNAENRAKQTIPHTGGSKPNARRIEEMAAETGRRPGRGQVYLETHKKGDGTYIDSAKEKCDQIEELLSQSTIDETVISTNDAVGKVLGGEHSGRVRCLGLGAIPTKSFRKPRFQLDGRTNPTTSVSDCPSQCHQKLSQVQESCDILRNAFKSYLIMKEGHIPEEFAGIFSSPPSTPSDEASGDNLANTVGRSSAGSTSASNNPRDVV